MIGTVITCDDQMDTADPTRRVGFMEIRAIDPVSMLTENTPDIDRESLQ